MAAEWNPSTFHSGTLRAEDDLCWSSLLESFHGAVCISEQYASQYADEQARFMLAFPEDYLFRSGLAVAFIEASMAMVQLNDFCVLCLQQAAGYLEGLRSDLDKLASGRQRVGIYTGEMIDIVQDAVWTWEDTNLFLVRAMALIMLSAFLERSLKSIYLEVAETAKVPRPRPGEGKIQCYLRHLQDECGLEFVEPTASIAQRERCRKLRNEFAHGDWDAVKSEVANIRLRDAFGAVTELLDNLEAAYESQLSALNQMRDP